LADQSFADRDRILDPKGLILNDLQKIRSPKVARSMHGWIDEMMD
jgi:hypothetical protein